MFNFFRKKKPVFDPALGDALGKILLKEAKVGKIDVALSEIKLLRTGMWDERAFYVDLVGQYLKNTETFPDTACGNLLKGSHAIYRAWEARGSGRATTVSEDGWESFFELLQTAEKALMRSAVQDPTDPTPFAFLQTVSMGLQLDLGIAQAWLQEATSRDPLNQQAHYKHLFFLCKKWRGGTHDEMYAFARSTVEKLPQDSTLGSLLYLAYQEHYLYLTVFDEDEEGAKAFVKDADIHQESIDVYEKFLASNSSIEKVSDYWPHNVTIWWFYMLKMPEITRQESAKTGLYFTEYPWSVFYHNPATAYEKISGYGK